jgi:hypothetical protein
MTNLTKIDFFEISGDIDKLKLKTHEKITKVSLGSSISECSNLLRSLPNMEYLGLREIDNDSQFEWIIRNMKKLRRISCSKFDEQIVYELYEGMKGFH